jgi:hypothetical protein
MALGRWVAFASVRLTEKRVRRAGASSASAGNGEGTECLRSAGCWCCRVWLPGCWPGQGGQAAAPPPSRTTFRVPATGFLVRDRAVPLPRRFSGHTLSVGRLWNGRTPGEETLAVDLRDEKGRSVDAVRCRVNSRLTRPDPEYGADFRIDVLETPAADGAVLVLRLRFPPDASDVNGTRSHYVAHCRDWQSYRVRWGEYKLPKKATSRDLCRVGIRDGKFQILFPPPKAKYDP